jgi:hypothetical protein
MKVFYKKMEQSLVNKNGKVKKVTRIKQHNGKKGVEIINNDGKETRKTFKVKKNSKPKIGKIVTFVPFLRRLSQRNRIMEKKFSKKISQKRGRKTRRRRSSSRKKIMPIFISNSNSANSNSANSKRSNNLAGKMTRRKKRRRKKSKKNNGFFHNFLGV